MTTARESTLLERLTFFSDAVFAIAITLLVIEIRLPEFHPETDQALLEVLGNLTPHYVGFIVSFLVIGRFWIGHHRLFGQLARSDDKLTSANLLLLLGVAFMPFPTAVFSAHATLRTATWFYAGWLVVLGLLNANVVRLAVRPGLLAAEHDPLQIEKTLHGMWLPVLIGFGAAVGAFVNQLTVLAVLVFGPFVGTVIVNALSERSARRRVAPRQEEQNAQRQVDAGEQERQ